mgnify:CR=1 FL=1
MKFLKSALCAAAASAALSGAAMAQDDSAPTFAFNVGATSDYLFRGLTQTAKDPAVFGGVDMTAGLFYAGAWASNVDWGVETDLYAGVKPVVGPVTFDIGAIYYGYPDSDIKNAAYWEGKVAATIPAGEGTLGLAYYYSPEFFGKTGKADYVSTGDWSKKSIKEAKSYGKVNVAASGEASNFTAIPARSEWKLDPEASYVHICSNETIGGVEYHWTPDTGNVPLVADMSSNILSRPIDVSKYGLIYAGAQKNMGPSGLTIVIVRDDLIGHALPICPSAFNYQLQSENDSMYNTPPTYAIYIAGLVFKWIKAQGGLAAMEAHNKAKAALLYDFLDSSSFYRNPVAPADRSLMNVPFKLKDDALDEAFLKQNEIVEATMKGEVIAELNALGAEFRMSPEQVQSCINDRTIIRRINDVRADTQTKGIDSTPTFMVDGVVLPDNSWPSVQAAIAAGLAAGGGAAPAAPTETPAAPATAPAAPATAPAAPASSSGPLHGPDEPH